MSVARIADKFKGKFAPLKFRAIEKYSELRYISTHRTVTYKNDESNKLRFNIIVPTIENKDVFGGVDTALKIFFECSKNIDCDIRILSLSTYENLYKGLPKNILSDPHKFVKIIEIEGDVLSIRKRDVFFATYWSTALLCEEVIEWQIKTFNLNPKLIYLIQDYEPGFYPWSTEYIESERTYRFDFDTIAVFNSSLLNNYFTEIGYKFYKSFYFEPTLNNELKNKIKKVKQSNNRKKQIIIYGRPQEHRNAFTLIIGSLGLLDERLGSEAKNWKVISLGTKHKNIKFSNGLCVKSLGKVNIIRYANYMLESYAGISLMVSPHPSYPPLEMSTFGVRTITNVFANKDLKNFNRNIISLTKYSPHDISKELLSLINEYETHQPEIILDSPYVLDTTGIKKVVQEITEEIRKVYGS